VQLDKVIIEICTKSRAALEKEVSSPSEVSGIEECLKGSDAELGCKGQRERLGRLRTGSPGREDSFGKGRGGKEQVCQGALRTDQSTRW
jgi:hypothetical protein